MPPRQLTGFQQASLEVEGGKELKCWFNPKDYTIAKQNQWNAKTVPGVSLPKAEFGGGQPRKLTLDLLFDATDSKDTKKDIAKDTAMLFWMMEAEKSKAQGKNSARPPTVRFKWGETVRFWGYIDSLSVQYLLFNSSGAPIRAQAKVSLIQAEKEVDESSLPGSTKPANPTTRALPGIGSHVVRDGDSLASIAYAHYSDATKWRPIAEANGIDDPLSLQRGVTLSIPRLVG